MFHYDSIIFYILSTFNFYTTVAIEIELNIRMYVAHYHLCVLFLTKSNLLDFDCFD